MAPPKKEKKKGPVGVEDDYVAPRQTAQPDPHDEGLERERAAYARESGQYQQGPRFYEDDLDKPRAWSGPTIARMQGDLVAAGLLSKKGFALGEYDDRTRNAYKKVLSYANQLGVGIDDALSRLLRSSYGGLGGGGGGGGGGGRGRAAFAPTLPNPDDVKAVIDATVPKILGRTLTDTEKQAVVAAYNAVVTGAQRAEYDGGTVTQAPQADTFAEQKARELHPEETDLFQKFSLVGDVTRLLGLGGQVQQGNL